jgi:hypothetical protein
MARDHSTVFTRPGRCRCKNEPPGAFRYPLGRAPLPGIAIASLPTSPPTLPPPMRLKG